MRNKNLHEKIIIHWNKRLSGIIDGVDTFQDIEAMTPKLWKKYNDIIKNFHTLELFLRYEKDYLHGKLLELGEKIPDEENEK